MFTAIRTHWQTHHSVCLRLQLALIQDIDGVPIPSVTIQVSYGCLYWLILFPSLVLFLYISSHLFLSLFPSLTSLQVKVKASCVVQSSKLTVSIQPPLAVTQDQFVLEPMGQSISAFLILILYYSAVLMRRIDSFHWLNFTFLSYLEQKWLPGEASLVSLHQSLIKVITTTQAMNLNT